MTTSLNQRRRASAAARSSGLIRREHGGGSLTSRTLDLGVRATIRPVISAWALVPGAPWPYALVDQLGRLLPTQPGTTFERIRLPHCPATRVTTDASATSARTIVYLHGGAFLVGGNHLHRQMLSRIAHLTGATMIVPNYRKLPRHSITDASEDALDAYRYALDHGADPANTTFMGDSAGGFLAIMLGVAAQQAGLPAPAGIVALSPLVDFAATGTPYPGCTLFPKSAIGRFQAIAARVNRRKGLGASIDSPPHQPRRGLPPTLIQASAHESLFGDIERLAESLAAAGVRVELEVWDRQVHVFQAAAGILREGAQAIQNIASFTDRVTAATHDQVDAGIA